MSCDSAGPAALCRQSAFSVKLLRVPRYPLQESGWSGRHPRDRYDPEMASKGLSTSPLRREERAGGACAGVARRMAGRRSRPFDVVPVNHVLFLVDLMLLMFSISNVVTRRPVSAQAPAAMSGTPFRPHYHFCRALAAVGEVRNRRGSRGSRFAI